MNSKGYICRRDDVRHIFNPIVYGGSEGALKHGRGVGKSPPPLAKIQTTKAVDLKLGTLIK